ncbi:hypothetical protein GN956_G10517 [Arapaima gigas]
MHTAASTFVYPWPTRDAPPAKDCRRCRDEPLTWIMDGMAAAVEADEETQRRMAATICSAQTFIKLITGVPGPSDALHLESSK